MNPVEQARLENAICFFAAEHKKRTKKDLPQTALYKYLAFLDFWSLENTGKPALNLTYRAMERGPVPIELYGKLEELSSALFAVKPGAKDTKSLFIIAKKAPDLDEFSGKELKEMRRLVEIFGDTLLNTGHFSNASHEKMPVWQRTYKTKPNTIINYKLHFCGDIDKKEPDTLTPEEESFLMFRALGGLHGNL